MNWEVECRRQLAATLGLLVSATAAMGQSVCAPQIQWHQPVGTISFEGPRAIQQTADGGYIVGGTWIQYERLASGNITSTNHGAEDFLIVRLDARGEKLWDRGFGGPSMDLLYALQQTADGGFIMGGLSWGEPGGSKTSPWYGQADFWIVRTDASGNKLWDKTFGGSEYDSLRSLQQTADGGFVLGGSSASSAGGNKTSPNFGNDDFWVIRLDVDGNKLWERTFGGSASDALMSLKQTSDGGFILAGPSHSPASGTKTSSHYGDPWQPDYWVVRIEANGNQLWDKTYGGQYTDFASAVLQTSDGGFLVGGLSFSGTNSSKTSPQLGEGDFWLLRLDAAGNHVWDRSYGGSSWEDMHSLALTSDGGCVMAGISTSLVNGTKQSPARGEGDVWLARVDADGNQLWDGTYGGNSYDVGYSVKPTPDGGVIVAALSYSTDGDRSGSFGDGDFWIVKLAALNLEDCDNDGVPNEADQCPETASGKVVNSAGCAIDQICACDEFVRHSHYVACVRHAATDFQHAGLISSDQQREISAQAMAASCPPVRSEGPDIVFGLPHVAIEAGVLSIQSEGSYLAVLPSTPGTPDPYGVSILLGEADSGIFFDVSAPVSESSDPRWYLDVKAYGRFTSGGDGLIASARGTKPGWQDYPVQVDLSALNPSSVTIQYLCNNTVLQEETFSGPIGNFSVGYPFYYPTPRFNPFWRMADGSVGALLELVQEGDCGDSSYPYNQIFVRADSSAREVQYISRVDAVAGGGLESFSFSDGRLGMFNRPHKALGRVLFDAANGHLTVTEIEPPEPWFFNGLIIGPKEANELVEVDFEPIELGSNALIRILPVAFLRWEPGDERLPQDVFVFGTIENVNGALAVTVDFSPLYAAGVEVTALKNGVITGRLSVTNSSIAGTLRRKNQDIPRLASFTTAAPDGTLGFGLDHVATFTTSDGTELHGNHLRFTPVTVALEAISVTQVTLETRALPSFTITGERSQPATPRLNASAEGQSIVLSWTDNTRLFAIESAASLSEDFSIMTNEVEVVGNQNVFSIPVEAAPRFFRLRR